jgi:hypothetical protein
LIELIAFFAALWHIKELLQMVGIAIIKQFPFAAFGAFLIDYGVKLGSFQHSNFEKAKFVKCFRVKLAASD